MEGKMKVLLAAVNAKYIHSNPAVYSLKAYAQERLKTAGLGRTKIQIEISEYTINQQTDAILSDLYRKKPDVAAFSCYIWNWRMIRELSAELAKVLPGVPIWLGGPEVSFDAERILEEIPAVSGIMVGEGEQTFTELLEYYADTADMSANGKRGKGGKSGSGLGKIDGIVYRKERQIFRTGVRKATDIGALPFLYKDMENFRNRIIYYESSRGCPFRCSYCLSSIDRSVRLRDMETVKDELQFFLEHKVAQVKFIDRTFNCSREHARTVWRYILERDNGITNFHFEIAADLLDEEELTLLSEMRPGLVQLEIGVQSVNPDTLREINRYTDMGKLREAVQRILRTRNVHVHLDLIAGLPFEDYNSFRHSFNEVYGMRAQQLQLGFLKVLKGSPMYEKAGGYGINYTSLPPYEVLYSKWISYEEICKLKKIEEMVELYYNSGQFAHTLPVLERVFESPFAFYEKLADYYEENGYFLNNPSRSYRYEVLLGFACCHDGGREALYRELLTYDMYLRENMKSRPGFAKDLSEYKGRIRHFYEDEERMREVLPDYGAFQPRQAARMTHMEVFCYPVWVEAPAGMDRLEEPQMVLFDYGRRNPLTKEAETKICPY
jgi:Fe-S oxidoreductase